MALKDLKQELKEIIKDYENPKEGPSGSYWTSKIGKRFLFFQELGIIVLTDNDTYIDGLKLIEYIKADIIKTCRKIKEKEKCPKCGKVGDCVPIEGAFGCDEHGLYGDWGIYSEIEALMEWAGLKESDLK